MPNDFSIADDILIAGFNEKGRDHDATLDEVLRVYWQVILKHIKDKGLFRCTSIPFFDEVISKQGVSPDSKKSASTNRHATTKIQEGITIISRCNELPQLVFTSNCKSV